MTVTAFAIGDFIAVQRRGTGHIIDRTYLAFDQPAIRTKCHRIVGTILPTDVKVDAATCRQCLA